MATALAALRTWRPDLTPDDADRLLTETGAQSAAGRVLDVGAAFTAAGLAASPVPPAVAPSPSPDHDRDPATFARVVKLTTPEAEIDGSRDRDRIEAGTQRARHEPANGNANDVRVYARGRGAKLKRVALRTRDFVDAPHSCSFLAVASRRQFSDPSGTSPCESGRPRQTQDDEVRRRDRSLSLFWRPMCPVLMPASSRFARAVQLGQLSRVRAGRRRAGRSSSNLQCPIAAGKRTDWPGRRLLELAANSGSGARAAWTVSAPAGTSLQRLDVTRAFQKWDNDWSVSVRTAEQSVLDTCELTGVQVYCASGLDAGSSGRLHRPSHPSVSFASSRLRGRARPHVPEGHRQHSGLGRDLQLGALW